MALANTLTLPNDPLLFALGSSAEFGLRIAIRLGLRLADHEERDFDGGEHKARPMEEVSGRDAYVIHSLQGEAGASANDKLVRLLFFIGALKDAGAASVTAVTPYLAYSRKDRRTKPRDPVATKYVAELFESMGTDRLVTVEVHNLGAFENAFRICRPEHVPVARLFAAHIAEMVGDAPLAVVSPDAGGNKRAELLRQALEHHTGRPVKKGIMDKHRSMGVVSGSYFAGDVAGCITIIFDDMIASGATILRATEACREASASKIIAAAPHAVFGEKSALFGPGAPDIVLVSDSIPLDPRLPDSSAAIVQIVEVSGLVGDVIGRLHSGEAVSDLLPYS